MSTLYDAILKKARGQSAIRGQLGALAAIDEASEAERQQAEMLLGLPAWRPQDQARGEALLRQVRRRIREHDEALVEILLESED